MNEHEERELTPSEAAVDTGFRIRRWYHRRDVRFVGLIVVFVVAFQGYGYFTGPSRISESLQTALRAGEKKVDVLIWANFPAEAFHMELYQTMGAIRGEMDGAVRLANVEPKDIKFLSRKYWIKNIDLAPPEN